MAGEKTQAELKAQIDAGIKVNGNREITPPIHNAIETAIINSCLNKKDGGILEAISYYSSLFTLTDPASLVYKKYVDDLIAGLSGLYLIQGTNTLTEPLAFIDDYVGIGTDDTLDAALTIFSDENKGLKMRGASVSGFDRFHLYVDMATEDVIFDTINAGLFFKRSGTDVMMFDSISTTLYQHVITGTTANRGINLDKGNQGNRLMFYVSDGSSGLTDSEGYLDLNNSSMHVRAGSGYGKTWDFDSGGNFKINNGDLQTTDQSKAHYWGSESVNGSWRQRIDGSDFIKERRESGVWVEKERLSP